MTRAAVEVECSGKQAFQTRSDAEFVVKRMRSGRNNIRAVQAYHCGYCQDWHIGSQPPAKHRPRGK